MGRTAVKPYEVTQPRARRDALRAELVARIPWWYSPWGHLAFPSLVGLGMVAAVIALLDRPSALELLTVPVALVLVNLNEWHIHRNCSTAGAGRSRYCSGGTRPSTT